jgi:DNA-binding MarR family transcriptional regulator
VVDALVDAVHDGRRQVAAGARRPTRLAAEGVVGAVLEVLHKRLSSGSGEPVARLRSPLTAMVVLPYLGPTVAERELTRRVPRCRRPASHDMNPKADLLRDLGMRVTYRTVRVLLAVAKLDAVGPWPNSRQVAEAAGVSDQGQISRLLRRLEHQGLIANEAVSHRRGEPNAWTLTDRGREIERAIRAQSELEERRHDVSR